MPIASARRLAALLASTLAAVSIAGCATGNVPVDGTSRSSPSGQCYALDHVTPARRALAQSVLRRAADGEALYTLRGSIKPVSSSFVEFRVRVAPTIDQAALDSVAEYQAILPALQCGSVGMLVSVFGETYPGRDTTTRDRFVSVIAYDRSALAATIARHAEFFGALGVVPNSAPEIVVAAVEHAPRAARWRGYGYIFGYPDEAVDFFVASGIKADSIDRASVAAGTRTRSYVEPRDFRRIETYRKFAECKGCDATASSFVYAVPKGAPESDSDRRLRERAAPVYAEYARRRASITTAEGDFAGLLRTWVLASPQ